MRRLSMSTVAIWRTLASRREPLAPQVSQAGRARGTARGLDGADGGERSQAFCELLWG